MTDGRKDAHGAEGGTGAAGMGARGRRVNIPRAGGNVPHLVDPSRRNDPHRTDEEPVSWRA